MRIVRVHNPSGLRTTKVRKGKKTMAARRRRKAGTTTRRRRRRTVAINPRRRRHSRRRRHNPVVLHRRHSRRRRRGGFRRRNPSALRVGQIAKDMIYGAGGAILTRSVTSIVSGFVPAAFGGSPFIEPVLQAAAAATVVRWAGKKFLGSAQGDIMMLGGLISAGLSLADRFVPNLQGQLTSIVRMPVAAAPGAGQVGGAQALSDVEDVDLVASGFGGFGDVEDVDPSILAY